MESINCTNNWMQFDIRASRFPIRNRYTVSHCVLQPQLVRYRINGEVDPFFWKIMVALHFSHGLYKPPSVEHRFLPFNTCDARVGKISFPVVFLLRILWQRRRTYNLFTSKENASKCHKASHEDYSWLKNQLTMILKVCWNWCHPLKHLLIKCCCKPSFSKPVHFAPLL